MIGRLIGLGSAAKNVGDAVSGVWGTIKGGKVKQDEATHREQMAVHEQFSAEFAGRPPLVAAPPPTLPIEPVTGKDSPAIDKMLDDLLRREGGYVNHPADKGGPTNFGITQRTLEAWRGKPLTAADVQALTVEEARKIYRAKYFYEPSLHALPEGIQAHVFDIAVNSGPGQAIRLLQRALNRLGVKLKEDGGLGPATRAAAETRNPADINRELVDVRKRFYEDLVARDPEQHVFIAGWLKRANEFVA